MPIISPTAISPHRIGGKSWRTYWAIQDEVLFFGLYSEISGGKMPNKKAGASDFLTVTGIAGSETYQCPNTAPYKAADTDYIWFMQDGTQRTVTTAELIGYDLQRTPVKYEDGSPHEIVAIIILNAAVTGTKRNLLFRDMWLPVLWDNNLNAYGHLKDNRVTQNIWQHEVDAYNYGLTTPLTGGQNVLLTTFVKSLKDGLLINNLSEAFDCMWIIGGETDESSLRNIAKNAHYLLEVNSPTFTQYEGYVGGSTGYLRTQYNPSTQGVKYTLNSASMGIYCRNDVAANPALFGARKGYGDDMAYINPRHSSNIFYHPLNQDLTTDIEAASPSSVGMFTVSRTGSGTLTAYKNKTIVNESVNSSSAIPNYEYYLLGINNNGSPDLRTTQQVAFAFLGRGFTTAEIGVIVDAIEAYMDANGKGVI